jgi:hypothetical protein
MNYVAGLAPALAQCLTEAPVSVYRELSAIIEKY